MKAFIQSLSFTSGAIALAFVSALVVWLLCSVFPVRLRKLWVVIVPLALANGLYWSAPWLEANGSEYERAVVWSEYHNWALIFLIPWFLAGAIPSAVVVWILEKRRPS